MPWLVCENSQIQIQNPKLKATHPSQMNMADSERMAGALDVAGYSCTAEAEDADVLVYNTCSIREKAELKVYSALGRQVSQRSGRRWRGGVGQSVPPMSRATTDVCSGV